MSFYSILLSKALAKNQINLEDQILVVCGGTKDKNSFADLGFKNVTISNLDVRMKGNEYHPYEWSFQDAENLNFEDNSFDFVVVHAGLHHCASPHRGLLEMYRVARKGVVVFEARDSMVLRLGKRLGLVPDYEIEAVVTNDYKYGGIRNTAVPNFIYRWKEAEVEKAINSFNPQTINDYHYHYHLRVPLKRLSLSKNRMKLLAAKLLQTVLGLFTFFFPKQCNEFGFVVLKTDKVHPWIIKSGTEYTIDRAYSEKLYNDNYTN